MIEWDSITSILGHAAKEFIAIKEGTRDERITKVISSLEGEATAAAAEVKDSIGMIVTPHLIVLDDVLSSQLTPAVPVPAAPVPAAKCGCFAWLKARKARKAC